MDLKPQTPAKGIMLQADFGYSKSNERSSKKWQVI
jgi:hypothetical protein